MPPTCPLLRQEAHVVSVLFCLMIAVIVVQMLWEARPGLESRWWASRQRAGGIAAGLESPLGRGSDPRERPRPVGRLAVLQLVSPEEPAAKDTPRQCVSSARSTGRIQPTHPRSRHPRWQGPGGRVRGAQGLPCNYPRVMARSRLWLSSCASSWWATRSWKCCSPG